MVEKYWYCTYKEKALMIIMKTVGFNRLVVMSLILGYGRFEGR